MSDGSVRQSATLIIQNVFLDGYEKPLRAFIDTGASNNFVRAQVMTQHGVGLLDVKEEMIIRLANGSKMKMPKQAIRLAMKFQVFRGEDEFMLLDLDNKFGVILGMPLLKRYRLDGYEDRCQQVAQRYLGLHDDD
ncbi:Aspartic peptidase domain [Plasmopara halstedii]|uniref:Aspartic peptidase domain n=1 Tax=Plasmopara halstedii TaxID=4781 RepID=A0A0P1AE73_PLAHL|nr:Aspartic peptidase domain [Plasmopara halstedii]CEG38648.1 Aspartic peptidase domain [Plasmopara halstedii]|eukprot:XP_024575017.1 Aspartic peptidase domain [Plasmopara halstedii]